MPYKDPEKRRENQRKNAAVRKEAMKQADPERYELEKQKLAERSRKSYERNRERIRADYKKWYHEQGGKQYHLAQRHKTGVHIPWAEYQVKLAEERAEKCKRQVEWSKTPKGQRSRCRQTIRRAGYNITIDDYDNMYIKTEGKCAICGEHRPQYGQLRHSIDHCHVTGKVRNLLCPNCNTALGKFKENIDIMKKAIEYVKLHANDSKMEA